MGKVKETIQNGYRVREHLKQGYYSQANGRSYTYITCPFCGCEVKAYVWSLAGGGKKCDDCDALHASFNVSMIKGDSDESR